MLPPKHIKRTNSTTDPGNRDKRHPSIRLAVEIKVKPCSFLSYFAPLMCLLLFILTHWLPLPV